MPRSICRRLLFLLTLLLLAAGVSRAAPPTLNSLFPAGAQRGQEVELTAAGNFSNWPASVWVDREAIKVEALKDKGKLKVTVPGDTPAGVYYLRVFDAEGASQLRPLLVDTLPEATEVEPNNELDQAQLLEQSTIVNGRLQSGGDVDGFRIKLQQGQTLVASLQGNHGLGSPMDAVLQVCDAQGFTLEQNDDARGIDPQIAFEAPRDGEYVVRTFAFPAKPNSSIAFSGASNYIYRLTLTNGGFIDHTVPLVVSTQQPSGVSLFGWNIPDGAARVDSASGAAAAAFAFHPELASSVLLESTPYPPLAAAAETSLDQPQSIETPCSITGRIGQPRSVNVFRFSATKGQKLTFRAEADALGFPLDPLLQIIDGEGKVLAEADDTNRRRDCELTHTIPADGEYRLLIRDLHWHGGFRYVYRLTVAQAKPDFTVKLAADSFVLTAGKPLEIPVAIERKNGFADVIEVVANGLPEGVRCEVVKSEGKGDTAKAVKLVLNADAGPKSSAFQVTATSGDVQRTARFPIAGLTVEHTQAWLTVK